MSTRATVVYYVSAHGLGHSARSVAACNALPPQLRLIVRTGAPEWFWRLECEREMEWAPASFDVGAVQADNLTSLPGPSLRAWEHMEAQNQRRREQELAWLREVGAEVVVTDSGPFPLELAAALEIPGVFVGNFTWLDIYEAWREELPPGEDSDRLEHLLPGLERAYGCARRAFATLPTMALRGLEGCEISPVEGVVRPARDVSEALCSALGIPTSRTRVLLSMGIYGLPFQWEALGRLPAIQFLSFNAPPEAAPWVRAVPCPPWRSHDVTASVHAVVAKAGYGTIWECMSAGIPLLYPPRQHFAEHGCLDEALRRWGGGLPLAADAFLGLDLGEALERALALHPSPLASGGAAQIAQGILALLGR